MTRAVANTDSVIGRCHGTIGGNSRFDSASVGCTKLNRVSTNLHARVERLGIECFERVCTLAAGTPEKADVKLLRSNDERGGLARKLIASSVKCRRSDIWL